MCRWPLEANSIKITNLLFLLFTKCFKKSVGDINIIFCFEGFFPMSTRISYFTNIVILLNRVVVKRWIISVPLKQIYFVFSPHYKKDRMHSLTFLFKVNRRKLGDNDDTRRERENRKITFRIKQKQIKINDKIIIDKPRTKIGNKKGQSQSDI